MQVRLLALGALVSLLAAGELCALAGDGAAERDGARLSFALGEDERLTVAGRLPRGDTSGDLAALLPEADVSGVSQAPAGEQPGDEVSWRRAIEALSIVLPRFRSASAGLEDGTLTIEGELKRGLSAAGVQAALRVALGGEWTLDLELVETAPLAEVVLQHGERSLTMRGLLPSGLAPEDALALVGEEADDGGLAGGGEGDAQAWSRALAALGEALDLFFTASAKLSDGELSVTGALRPGYPRAAVEERLGERMPPGWSVEVRADEAAPSEGDRRVELASGRRETYRNGYWLPEVDFPVSAGRCAAEADRVLAEGLPFAEGAAQVDEEALPVLDRLAAIAIRCLNSSRLSLEIGGHTESVGNDAANERLSQARAEAVRQALVDRGVRAASVVARGHGESRPIATNNTAQGRALNRRITFDWTDPTG